MWNCMKHDYFGHSSCNQESWAVCCSLGWGHRHPQQLVWECQAWSNTKEEAARLKLFVTLERVWQLCCAQPCPASCSSREQAAGPQRDPLWPGRALGGKGEGTAPTVAAFCHFSPTARTMRAGSPRSRSSYRCWGHSGPGSGQWVRAIGKGHPTSPIPYSPHIKSGDHKCFSAQFSERKQ